MKFLGKSVGAMIKNKDGNYLCLYRLKIPKGLACVAGHIDEGETPEEAIIREVREEAGIEIDNLKEVFHDILPNSCPQEHDGHEWWVYEIYSFRGVPKLTEPDKHRFVKFMSLAEIKDYIKNKDADPAWSDYILPRLKIISEE